MPTLNSMAFENTPESHLTSTECIYSNFAALWGLNMAMAISSIFFPPGNVCLRKRILRQS